MDRDHISDLIELGSTKEGVQKVQARAKEDMQDAGYGLTLHNACAATLSEFMNFCDIDIPVTLGAGKLAQHIHERGWQKITVGNQRAGDVAVAENNVHIFLVVQAIDNDQMVIADNQAPGPHKRKASGSPELNHSPTAYFLRGEGVVWSLVPDKKVDVDAAIPNPDIFPRGDEDTSNLK